PSPPDAPLTRVHRHDLFTGSCIDESGVRPCGVGLTAHGSANRMRIADGSCLGRTRDHMTWSGAGADAWVVAIHRGEVPSHQGPNKARKAGSTPAGILG